jgi:hypothetical protein
MNDIDLANYDGSTTAKKVYPIGNGICYTGNFDGGYHKIQNITLNFPSLSNVGLFNSTCYPSVIKYTVLENVAIVGGAASGALVGGNNGLIINSGVTGGTVSGANNTGGLAGSSWGYVSNSFAKVDVNGTSTFVGGLVGDGRGGVFRSYTWGNVTAGGAVQYVGGITGIGKVVVGYAFGSVPNSGTNRGAISGSSPSYHTFYNSSAATPPASNGATYLSSASFLNASNFTSDQWPVGTVADGASNNYWVIANGLPPRLWWEIDPAQRPVGDILNGEGTLQSPYLIETPDQLLNFDQALMTGWGTHFALANDIDLQGKYLISLGISSLNGDVTVNFDGRGYAVSNYIQDKGYSGFFGGTEGGSIQNLKLLDVTITNALGGAGILAPDLEDIHIAKIFVSGSVASTGSYVGSIAGSFRNNSSAREIAADVDISGQDYLGGLFGLATIDSGDPDQGFIENCSYKGAIVDTFAGGNHVGGLVGRAEYTTILNRCFSQAVFTSSASGGIVGTVSNAFVLFSDNYFDAEIDGNAGTTAGSTAFSDATNSGNRGLGLSTAQTLQQSNFVNFDFSTVWKINPGVESPSLLWMDNN